MTHLRTPLKVFLLLGVFIGTGVLLNTVLSVLSFDKKHREFTAEKLMAIMENAKQPLEYGLGLGLGLNEMTNLKELLGQVMGKHTGIDFVGIVADDGTAISSVKRGRKTVVPDYNFMLKEADKSGLRKFSQGEFNGLSFALENSFGVNVGYLVVTYDDVETRSMTWQTARFLWPYAAGSIVFLLLMSYLLNRKVFRKMEQLTEESGQCFDSLSGYGEALVISANNPVANELRAYQKKIQSIINENCDGEVGLNEGDHT